MPCIGTPHSKKSNCPCFCQCSTIVAGWSHRWMVVMVFPILISTFTFQFSHQSITGLPTDPNHNPNSVITFHNLVIRRVSILEILWPIFQFLLSWADLKLLNLRDIFVFFVELVKLCPNVKIFWPSNDLGNQKMHEALNLAEFFGEYRCNWVNLTSFRNVATVCCGR